jgi:hypothetical protein
MTFSSNLLGVLLRISEMLCILAPFLSKKRAIRVAALHVKDLVSTTLISSSYLLHDSVHPFLVPESNGWSLFYLENLDAWDKHKGRHGHEIIELVGGRLLTFPVNYDLLSCIHLPDESQKQMVGQFENC